ncbi:MAG: hypothetical protein KJ630_01280 [Proteobacteria bacterium]|nr:hypothetical protein [Pseudomonadota bacterium]
MSAYTIDKLPDEALPSLDELVGDVRILAEKVGVRLALEIAELFDGTTARFYGTKRCILRWRDTQMREEYDRGGISVTDLARKHGVGERHTYNILGMAPLEDKQLKLF